MRELEVTLVVRILRRWRATPQSPANALCPDWYGDRETPLRADEVAELIAWLARRSPSAYLELFPSEPIARRPWG